MTKIKQKTKNTIALSYSATLKLMNVAATLAFVGGHKLQWKTTVKAASIMNSRVDISSAVMTHHSDEPLVRREFTALVDWTVEGAIADPSGYLFALEARLTALRGDHSSVEDELADIRQVLNDRGVATSWGPGTLAPAVKVAIDALCADLRYKQSGVPMEARPATSPSDIKRMADRQERAEGGDSQADRQIARLELERAEKGTQETIEGLEDLCVEVATHLLTLDYKVKVFSEKLAETKDLITTLQRKRKERRDARHIEFKRHREETGHTEDPIFIERTEGDFTITTNVTACLNSGEEISVTPALNIEASGWPKTQPIYAEIYGIEGCNDPDKIRSALESAQALGANLSPEHTMMLKGLQAQKSQVTQAERSGPGCDITQADYRPPATDVLDVDENGNTIMDGREYIAKLDRMMSDGTPESMSGEEYLALQRSRELAHGKSQD